MTFDITFQRSCAESYVVSAVDNEFFRRVGNFKPEILSFESFFKFFKQQIDYLFYAVAGKRSERHDVVETVKEFGTESGFKQCVDFFLCVFRNVSVGVYAVEDITASQIACYNYNGILEIDGSSLTIGNSAVVKHLQQHVEHVGMRFFDFVDSTTE